MSNPRAYLQPIDCLRSRFIGPVLSGLVFSGLLLSGCDVDPNEQQAIVELDLEAFRSEVQPVLSDRCANPACHGSAERPFAVFAPRLHRLNSDARHKNTPLSTAETELNYFHTLSFVHSDNPMASPFLLQPLSPSAGGSEHHGVVIFDSNDEPDFLRLQDWVTSAQR